MKDVLVGIAAVAIIVCAVVFVASHVSAGCADFYFFKACGQAFKP